MSDVDFQKILEELEKISFEAGEQNLENSIDLNTLRQQAQVEAELDLSQVFTQLLDKSVAELDKVPTPLTREEAEAFDLKHEGALEDIQTIKGKMQLAQEMLTKKINDEGGFTLDLSNRRATSQAARRFFGEKKKTITYEEYLEAKAYRDAKYEEEADDLKKRD